MTPEEQCKRDEEAEEKVEQAIEDFGERIDNGEYHFRRMPGIAPGFREGVKWCRETEVKELREKIENDAIDGYSIRPRIMHENDKEIYIFQCNRIVQLREQLRVAVDALRKAKSRYWERCYDGSGNTRALTLNEFDAEVDCALQKIEAMKGGKDG